ncbi:hypothetical protein ACFVDU_04470 [Streptomyces albidoflavus]
MATIQAMQRWQTDGYRTLGDLLAAAAQQELPALTWTLASTGGLIGETPAIAATRDEQWNAFTMWAHYHGGKVAETLRRDGRTLLSAPLLHAGKRVGILRAELPPAA